MIKHSPFRRIGVLATAILMTVGVLACAAGPAGAISCSANAPTYLSATSGNASASISFTAGSATCSITKYQYSTNAGSNWADAAAGTTSPITVNGLTNGTAYSILIRAYAGANGTASSAVSVTPGLPAAPTSLSATPGNGSASISFTAGSSNGVALTKYQYSTNGGYAWSDADAGTTSPVSISGLANGTAYSIKLRAVNATGNSAGSDAVNVTPRTTPSAPTSLYATADASKIYVTFVPGATGGAAITNYEYQLDGAGAWTAASPAAPTSPVVITAANGLSSTVKVRAVNPAGSGPESDAVTPVSSLPLSFVAGNGSSGTTVAGPALSTSLVRPYGGAFDSHGNLFILEIGFGMANRVVKITPDGTLSLFAGNGTTGTPVPGPALNSPLGDFMNGSAYGLAVDSADNVYIAGGGHRVVMKVTPDGTLSVVAGTINSAGSLSEGPALSSQMWSPIDVVVDSHDNLFVLDNTNARIVKITPGGTLSFFAGTGQMYGSIPAAVEGPALNSPLYNATGLGIDDFDNIYVADMGHSRVEKITPSGTLSFVAGTGTSGAPIPGPATTSPIYGPSDVAVDGIGNVYISDSYNYRIEKVTPDGTLSIIAGNGVSSSAAEGAAIASGLKNPGTIIDDRNGSLYIVDTGNHRVEKVTLNPGAPSAPVVTSATGGDGSASLTFTARGTNGSVITKYQYSIDDGATWVDADAGTSSPLTISGLANGQTHNVKVRAVNGVGAGPASHVAVAVTLDAGVTAPSAPTSIDVSARNGSALVSFTAGSDGGAAITKYQFSVDGGTNWSDAQAGTTSPVSITGLTNGTSYTVKLRAVNSEGAGDASSTSSSFTPRTTPSAPTALIGTDGTGSASVAFTAGSNGGAAITKYQVKVGTGSWVDAGTTSPISITGLSNYSTVQVRIRAVNAAGAGTPSEPVSVRPRNAAPTLTVASAAGRRSIHVEYSPVTILGATVNGYTATAYAKGTNTVVSTCHTTKLVRACDIASLTAGTQYDVRVVAYFKVASDPATRETLASAITTVTTGS